jgi:Spy/CpxP family protein refolding chaperone
MKELTTQRIVMGMLLGLVVLNIGLLGTIWALFVKKPAEISNDTQYFMAKELQLTELQSEQLEALRAPHLVETKQLLTEIYELKQMISAELFEMSPNVEQVDELAGRIGEKYTELEQLRFQYFLEMREMFEPDQQEELEKLMGELLRTIQPAPLPAGARPQAGAPLQETLPGQSGAPLEAKDACSGKSEGQACQFMTPHGVEVGTCRMHEQLVCVPTSVRSNPAPGGESRPGQR